MLDDIIELILEIVLDGMVEIAGSKKVPLPIRIALGAVLALLVLGLFGLLLYSGIQSGSVILIVISVLLMVATVIWVACKIGSFKRKQ